MSVITEFNGKNRFLSNFFPIKIRYEGIEYPTVEHAYQAAKTFDEEKRKFLAKIEHPGRVNLLGKKITPLRADWDEVKLDVMESLLRIKFQDDLMAANLLATGDSMLFENSSKAGSFWGADNGRGENKLGDLLMQIRKEVRNSLKTA